MPAIEQPKRYVRVRFKTPAGKQESWWAIKLGARASGTKAYRRVSRGGDWGSDGKDHILLLGETDIVYEHSAMMNPTYNMLETETEKY